MAGKYTYYPGCSSEGSASHLDRSFRAIAPRLGIEIEDIKDWNCCGASVGELAAGQLSNAVLSARNLAQAREQGEQDFMTPCAACYLNSHGVNEHVRKDEGFRADLNDALEAAGKSYDGELHVRHACEVLVNDVGIEAIEEQVSNPLDGIKIAGYVGCQTVRPFAATERGGNFDTYDRPQFLDDFIRATGAEAVDFDNATSCCGGSVAVMNPEKTLHLMKEILDEAEQKNVDAIATPCPLCQTNVEMYQAAINKKYGTDFQIPVVFYSQLMALAFGMDAGKDAALDRNTVKADKLIAAASPRKAGPSQT